MLALVLVFRLLLLMALLVTLAAWGAQLGGPAALHWAGGTAAAGAGAAAWGLFVAAHRRVEIGRIPRFVFEILLFGVGGLGLAMLGRPIAGVTLVLLAIAQRVVLIWLWRRKMVRRWEP